jgi:DNA polymerase
MHVTLDFETKSYADLAKVGTWAYSEDPTTEVICLCYALDDGDVQDWWPGKYPEFDLSPGAINYGNRMPLDLWNAMRDGATFEAHHVAFELSIWLNIMTKRYDWPAIPIPQWRDSMAAACYYALPAQLDRLCRALGFDGKDPDGGRLITKYSKLHLKTAKPLIPPEDFKKFVAYCVKDVELERAVSKWLGPLPDAEQEIFTRDLEINLRGIYLDQEGIDAATAIVEQRSGELETEFRALVGYGPGQTLKVRQWFHENGLLLDNLQADYLGDLLEEGDLPSGPTRRAIEIRLAINKASTKKLDAMSRQRGSDGRARFQTRYHGALTGRNTGSGFQPLNLNRGFEDMQPEQLVRDIMLRDPAWLDACYGDAMDAVAKASRYWIKAQSDNRIIAGDFSSVESVILACLAGETWKIEAHRNKAKIYELTADKIFGLPPGTVKKGDPRRQDGKVCELAFGYQGALGAWLKFDPKPIHSDETIIGFVKAWRREHPATRDFWRNLEEAAIAAVDRPHTPMRIEPSGIEFYYDDTFLSMELPNGKRLWYFKPELRAIMPRWHQPESKEDCSLGTCDCTPKTQLTYMAMKEGQWKRVPTYGGKLAENATQAVSREWLEVAKKRAAAIGYPIILTIYDEIAAEVAAGFGSAKELGDIMAQPVDWAPNWPVGVSVWESGRFKK